MSIQMISVCNKIIVVHNIKGRKDYFKIIFKSFYNLISSLETFFLRNILKPKIRKKITKHHKH